MKRTLSLLAATLLVLSLAPVASATDGIGVYFDEAGTINCSGAQGAYSTVTLYLVAKNISSVSGLSGWECALIFDPVAPIGLSVTLLNGGLNVLASPLFQVGLANAIPYAPAMRLAQISFLYAMAPVKVGIGPCTPSSFGPGSGWPDLPIGPGFAQGDDPGVLRRLYASSDTPSGTPLFYWVYYLAVDGATCPGFPVGVEESSWGSVKTLFK